MSRQTPPRGMDQSGPKFQDVIRTYGRMHIYKISPIGQETRKLQFLGSPVDAPAVANIADGTLALPCRVARLIYLILRIWKRSGIPDSRRSFLCWDWEMGYMALDGVTGANYKQSKLTKL